MPPPPPAKSERFGARLEVVTMSETLIGTANSRERTVKKFLEKPPARAVVLTMLADDDEDGGSVKLGEWPRAECTPVLAYDILEKLEEHAKEVGGAVRCELRYVDADGQSVASKVIKRQANHIESSEDVTRAAMQGDQRSVVVLANAQSLATQRMYTQAMAGVLEKYESIATRSNEENSRLYQRIAELELENKGLKELLAAAEEVARQGGEEGSTPTSEAQERVLKMFEAMAPHLIQRLLVPQTPPSTH